MSHGLKSTHWIQLVSNHISILINTTLSWQSEANQCRQQGTRRKALGNIGKGGITRSNEEKEKKRQTSLFIHPFTHTLKVRKGYPRIICHMLWRATLKKKLSYFLSHSRILQVWEKKLKSDSGTQQMGWISLSTSNRNDSFLKWRLFCSEVPFKA